MIFALSLLGAGVLFTGLAVQAWRHRANGRISLLEAGVLKTSGAEPLPLTTLDRWLQRFQLAMLALFGPVMIAIGGYALLSELAVL